MGGGATAPTRRPSARSKKVLRVKREIVLPHLALSNLDGRVSKSMPMTTLQSVAFEVSQARDEVTARLYEAERRLVQLQARLEPELLDDLEAAAAATYLERALHEVRNVRLAVSSDALRG